MSRGSSPGPRQRKNRAKTAKEVAADPQGAKAKLHDLVTHDVGERLPPGYTLCPDNPNLMLGTNGQKHFAPGHRLNPSARTPVREAEDYLYAGLARLKVGPGDPMFDEEDQLYMDVASFAFSRLVQLAAQTEYPATARQACMYLLDRRFGKPKERIEFDTGPSATEVLLERIRSDERRRHEIARASSINSPAPKQLPASLQGRDDEQAQEQAQGEPPDPGRKKRAKRRAGKSARANGSARKRE